jgi:D-cysteine desulfhydrase
MQYTKDTNIDRLYFNSLANPLPQYNNNFVFVNPSARIFYYFPGMINKLPYISLGNFPTPIQKLENLALYLEIPNLYIKRDDLTGRKFADGSQLFGGNKVRKLEFFLADAIYNGAQTVMTFGGVGSNHCTATAVYAHLLGLRCICLLKDQPNSSVVHRNLLLMHHYNAQMYWFPSMEVRNKSAAGIFLKNKQLWGDFPCVIPPGASLPVGVIGYVNAALELKEQIEQGLIPTPDYVYLAVGSMGTMTGLLLGLKIVNLPTKVIAINTDPDEKAQEFIDGVTNLFYKTNEFLNKLDSTFPLYNIVPSEICVLHDFCGKEYGAYTKEGIEAIELMRSKENILLDGTYTAKAFAGLIHHVNMHSLQNKIILFWNTWCSDMFESIIQETDYKKLPNEFRQYFEHH